MGGKGAEAGEKVGGDVRSTATSLLRQRETDGIVPAKSFINCRGIHSSIIFSRCTHSIKFGLSCGGYFTPVFFRERREG